MSSWLTTARLSASEWRTCDWWSAAVRPTMRSIVCAAPRVVQRAEHEVAGLGGLERREMASGSRSSPTRITSGPGAARSVAFAERRDLRAEFALDDQRARAAVQELHGILESVTMFTLRVSAISRIIAASVVDLPVPVGPVTSTRRT